MAEKRLSLRQMLAAGQRVRLLCSSCGRDRTVALAVLVSARDVNGDVTLSQIERRIICTRCWGKRANILVPSHSTVPEIDARERRIQTNVKGVPCPGCGTIEVSRSPPPACSAI